MGLNFLKLAILVDVPTVDQAAQDRVRHRRGAARVAGGFRRGCYRR